MYTQFELIEAAKMICEFLGDAAPNWLRMLAGASSESLSNVGLWNALIEEVKAEMRHDNDSNRTQNQ